MLPDCCRTAGLGREKPIHLRTSGGRYIGYMSVMSSPPGLSSFAQAAAQSCLMGGSSAHMNLQSP